MLAKTIKRPQEPRAGEKGRNARRVSRLLDSFRAKGNLADGVPINKGVESTLKVAFCRKETTDRLPPELKGDSGDNKILAVALEEQNKKMLGNQNEVVLISKDTNLLNNKLNSSSVDH